MRMCESWDAHMMKRPLMLYLEFIRQPVKLILCFWQHGWCRLKQPSFLSGGDRASRRPLPLPKLSQHETGLSRKLLIGWITIARP